MTGPVTPTSVPYPLAFEHLGRGDVDLLTADIRVMLATGAYTPATTDEFLTAVAGYETAGAGYTAGGKPLTGRSFGYDATAGHAVLSCDPVVWQGASFIARHAVIYATLTAGQVLLSRVDFAADLDPAGADVTLTFPSGALRLGPSAGS